MVKRALITGISGQDGSYLSELLLEKEYEVWGIVRRQRLDENQRLVHLGDRINLIEGDLSDQGSIISSLKKVEPDEIYNLAAQSFIGSSWQQPILTGDVTGLGVTRILEAAKIVIPDVKILQASSSEMFGNPHEAPQNENTPFYPRSPYGAAKLYGYWVCVNYREKYDMFITNSICFNHESPRRGLEFVTKKISHGVAAISLGLSKKIKLGNLDARRDWGHARDYVEAMHLMLQDKNPNDYVLATGITHSIRDCLDIAFECIGISDWSKFVEQDEQFMRPIETTQLVGDASKVYSNLGWQPKISFQELVEEMVKFDLDFLLNSIK